MIIALKLLIVVVWVGAGVSKFGKHFANVVPPMVSNSPCMPFKWVKRAHYRDFPRDMRPSRAAHFMAHVGRHHRGDRRPAGAAVLHEPRVTVAAVVVMVGFHLFIISTFPLAVPLEWNVLFAYASVFLFLGFPAWDGLRRRRHVVAVADGRRSSRRCCSSPSWATCARTWCRSCRRCASTPATGPRRCGRSPRGGGQAEPASPHRPATRSTSSSPSGYEPQSPRSRMQQTIAWRSMHSQGRGLFSVLLRTPARHRRAHRARGRVRLQLDHRVQLRRRPPARRGPDRRRAAEAAVRAGRVRRRMGGVAGRSAARCSTTRSSTPPSA